MLWLSAIEKLYSFEEVFYKASTDEVELRRTGLETVDYARRQIKAFACNGIACDTKLDTVVDLLFSREGFECPKWCEDDGREMQGACSETEVCKNQFRSCLTQEVFHGGTAKCAVAFKDKEIA